MRKQYPSQSDAPGFVAAIRKSLHARAKEGHAHYPKYLPLLVHAQKAIDREVTAMSADLYGDGVGEKNIQNLLHRFEAKCSAMSQSLQKETRQGITQLLAGDLKNNYKAFADLGIPVDPNELVWFTIYNGSLAGSAEDYRILPKDYVLDAIIKAPITAQRKLLETKETIEKILDQSKKPESKLAGLADFPDYEDLIVYAVLNHTSPAKFLRDVLNGEMKPPTLDPAYSDDDAASLIETVRKKQLENKIMGGGGSILGKTTLTAINSVADELFSKKEIQLPDDKSAKITKDLIIKLLRRYEDIYRRVEGKTIPDPLRPAVMKHVVLDFLKNCEILGGELSELISITVNYGRADGLVEKFPAAEVRRAAVKSPTNPVSYLTAERAAKALCPKP